MNIKITTTYPELPDDVKHAISELNELINTTATMVNPLWKHGYMRDPDLLALDNLKKMSMIVQKLMCDKRDDNFEVEF